MSSQVHIEASDVLDARPEAIYAVLTDYRVGHAAILPKSFFQEMRVEEGGQGAGTIINLRVKIMGKEVAARQLVSEPEPGRVLVEANDDGSATTTFTLEPLGDGNQTRLTIVTNMNASPGFQGWVETWLTPRLLRPIYQQEMRNLAEYIRTGSVAASSN